jgi:hypothetical protein
MAKDLLKDGNYVIAVDADGYQREFPMGKTVYSEKDGNFIITEGQIEGQEIVIAKADAENWIDGDANAYTDVTMRDFLRANTGFNVASGGNGASSLKEKIVNMTSAEILGANPSGDGFFQLIPSLGAGNWLDVESVLFEFKMVDTAYTMVSTGWLIQYEDGAIIYVVDKSVCTTPSDQRRSVRGQFSNDTVIPLNNAVGILSSDLLGFTLGDGTLKITLRYYEIFK